MSRSLQLVLALLLLPVLAQGQTPPTLERVRIGLPTSQGGPESGCTRNSTWAPVTVTLRGGKEGNPQGIYRLRIETTDLEDLRYQATVSVPALASDSLRSVTGYIVPGGEGATFRVHLESAERKVLRTLSLPSRESGKDLVVGSEDVLFLALGGGLSSLKRAADKLDRPEGKEVDPEQGRRQVVFAEDISQLPDRWIGYDAVDVVVLTTGKREFVLQLAQDSETPRRNALLEWVRRGGQLILSAGRNKQEVAQLLSRMPLLDVKVTGSEVVKGLPVLSNQWSERINLTPLEQVEIATVEVGKSVNVLVRDAKKPILMQSSCGLGRVLLVAFDLDTPPFTSWDGNESFWVRMQREVSPYLPTRQAGRPAGGPGAARPGWNMGEEGKFDIRAELKRGLEMFEEVPTISFGWVALFLLFYILLVGPLDYFVLKKVFKRLEWTWFTFPLTVLVVSVAAYVTAYSLKGDELRINKIDLVEVDLHQPNQIYGSSWFTLFSPRVASYTIGLEAAQEQWTAQSDQGGIRPVVTLLEVGDRGFRAGSQELFRKPYEYAEEEAGMLRVPIPVWSTRSFMANWRAAVKAKAPPVGITDDVGPLRRSRDGKGLVGRITNNLAVRLMDVTLIYREKRYNLEHLEPGEQKRVEPLFAADAQGQGRDLGGWFQDGSLAPGLPLAPSGRAIHVGFLQQRSAYQLMKPMLFFRASERSNTTNAGLRRLDQSWRLRPLPEYPIPDRPHYRDEVILLARVPMLSDLSEEVAKHPASPTRLWIGALPGEERTRPSLRGLTTQETYLRVFVPVE